jgi:hypothetical protein
MPSKHEHDKRVKMDGDTICTFILESPDIGLIRKANVFLIKTNVFVKNLCSCVKERQCNIRPRYSNKKAYIEKNKVGHYLQTCMMQESEIIIWEKDTFMSKNVILIVLVNFKILQ